MANGTYGGDVYGATLPTGGGSVVVSSALEHIVIDGLDVNDYITRYIADDPPFQFTPARKKLNWSSSALADGETLVGDEDHYTNAEMVFTVGTYQSADKDTALGVLDELTLKLQEARRNPGGITLDWTPAGSSQTLTFYILEAEYDDLLASRERGWFDNAFTGVVHLYLRPFGYGSERLTPLGYNDPFTRSSWAGGPWRFDFPVPGAGLTWVLALLTNATGNKRLYLPFTTVNSVTAMRFKTSPTLSGMEVGVIAKRLTSGTYLRAALTSSTFKIATASGNLAQVSYSPSASTRYWIQFAVQGDDLQADLFADGANPLTTAGLTSLATVSYSLTGGESGGPYGQTIKGNPGMFLAPNSATQGDLEVDQFMIRGMDDITTTEPLQAFEIPDVQGHVPAEARQVVTEGSSQTRAHYEWGLETRDYNPDAGAPIILDSDQFTTTGLTGVQATVAGTYDPGAGSASNCVQALNSLSTSKALAIFSTPTGSLSALTHVGTYKVRARVGGDPGVKCRWSWQVGEGPLQANNYANLPVTSSTTSWYELDLGTMIIPRALVGPQAWIGRFEAYSPSVNNGTVNIDYVEFIPMERYGVLRAPIQPVNPTIFSALDEFTYGSPDAPLTGKVVTPGGTWTVAPNGSPSNPPAAGDFTVNTTNHKAVRSATGDADLNHGRLVSVGTGAPATYAAIQAQVDVTTDLKDGQFKNTPIAADNIRIGLFVRMVDMNQWLALVLKQGVIDGFYYGDRPVLTVYKRTLVGGTPTTVKLGDRWLGRPNWDQNRTLQLVVDGAGVWAAYSWPAGTRQPGSPLISGVDADLASSGPLQTGKVGIFDAYTAPDALARRFDNFLAFVAPQDAVLYSGKHLEIRSGLIKREAAATTRYGNVPQPRGGNFFVPATGANGHVSRMAVKARRTDVDGGTPDTGISDEMTVAIFTTPRYLTPTGP